MMAAGRKARPLPRPSSMFWSVIVVSATMAKMSRGLNTTEKWTVATITDHTKRVRNTAKIRPVPTKQLKILKQNKNLKFLQSKAYEIVLLWIPGSASDSRKPAVLTVFPLRESEFLFGVIVQRLVLQIGRVDVGETPGGEHSFEPSVGGL